MRTIWREEPLEADLKDPGLELVLPEAAILSALSPDLLVPGVLPGLWPTPPGIAVRDVVAYFRGGNVVQVPREGYTEPVVIPKAEPKLFARR